MRSIHSRQGEAAWRGWRAKAATRRRAGWGAQAVWKARGLMLTITKAWVYDKQYVYTVNRSG